MERIWRVLSCCVSALNRNWYNSKSVHLRAPSKCTKSGSLAIKTLPQGRAVVESPPVPPLTRWNTFVGLNPAPTSSGPLPPILPLLLVGTHHWLDQARPNTVLCYPSCDYFWPILSRASLFNQMKYLRNLASLHYHCHCSELYFDLTKVQQLHCLHLSLTNLNQVIADW